jgi:hypothetical protein
MGSLDSKDQGKGGSASTERPHARNKRVWASVADTPEHVTREVFREALRRDPEKKRPWVGLVDGDPHQIERILAQCRKFEVEVLGVSGPSLANPFTHQGAEIWIDVWSPAFFYTFVPSNGTGYCVVPATIPAVPALVGVQASAQFAWADACAAGGLSASFALSVTIQP